MWTEEDINETAETVRVAVDAVMCTMDVVTEHVYLIGSYVKGTQTPDSDLDYLVELRGKLYPTWWEIQKIHKNLPPRVHVIFGTRRAQESMKKPYKEIL